MCREDPDRILLETLRANFPALQGFPDYYILRQSASSLAKANNELENREGRGGRLSLETRLTRNFKNLERKRVYLEAAYDDRLKEFHERRFLPGPLCPIGDFWLAAKVFLPERGHDPVAHYDSQGLGLAYNVAAKTWAVVHEPGSTELNLGMFTRVW